MGRSGFLIIIFICTLATANAQEDYNFTQIDSSTYANTLSENWDEVIRMGNYALDHEQDYFYLRLRMGIAYFQKNNYRAAAKHLEKAVAFNPDHGLSKDYLYHAYLYSGQHDEAVFVSGQMNDKMREVSGINNKHVFNYIYLATGPEISNNIEDHEFGDMPRGQSYRQQDLYGSSYYTHLGTKLQLHPRVSVYVGLSNLMISKKASLQYRWNRPDSIVEYDWGFEKFLLAQAGIEIQTYDYTLTQYNAYLNANIILGKGWSLKPALNYINVDTRSINIENQSKIVSDTAFYNSDTDSIAYFNYRDVGFEMKPTLLTLNNVVVSLALKKKISIFDLGLFGSWSNLNDFNQIQFGFSATYFPFGNLDFYGSSIFKVLTQEDETNLIFSQMIGMKLTHFLWAEGFGAFGNLSGTNESDALSVYNISDEIHLKTGINLTFVISSSVHLSARYQYLQKEGTRTISGMGIPGGMRTEELKYNNHSIIGGLKWTL